MAKKNKSDDPFTITMTIVLFGGILCIYSLIKTVIFLFKLFIYFIIFSINIIIFFINLIRKDKSKKIKYLKYSSKNKKGNKNKKRVKPKTTYYKEDEDTDDVDEELEKEMDYYCLDEWEKEMVRNGEYDPWSFEEEDLEEDDYHYLDED